MKKLTLSIATLGLVVLAACGGDDASPSSGSNGGAGKACLNTFTDGEQRCFTGESAAFLCGGTSSNLTSSVLVDACPAGHVLACPDVVGDGVTYFYKEGSDCHSN